MVFCLSQYMLANISVVSPLVVYSVMVSSSESCDINNASTALILVVVAVVIFESPAVYVLYLESNPAALP